MKQKFFWAACLLLLSFSFSAGANDGIMNNISTSLKAGNATELSKYFDTTVEMTILDNDAAYSKAQASAVLKDFFKKNAVKTFELIHKGSSGNGGQYGIGNLTTATGTYRTYFYIKQKGNNYFIQEIRFENE